ncbi:MAG: hypothetical protein QOF91_2486 [Alphaproteobacteria bacterium]|nr:hypothetical protein [Alphaproteobacteria bacterium]
MTVQRYIYGVGFGRLPRIPCHKKRACQTTGRLLRELCGHFVIHQTNLDLADFLVAEIAVVDATGAIVHRNRKWQETAIVGSLLPKQSGWNYFAECEAAVGRGCNESAAILTGLRAVLQGGMPVYVGTYSCPFNALFHWFQVLISAIDMDGARHAILMHVDVSPLQIDSLTGLPNRAMFDAQAGLVLSMARDAGRRTGIVILDMNHLKSINDKHGHQIGDQALKGLAAEIKKRAGADCVVARVGGDEFGVVLPAGYDALSLRRLLAQFTSGVACSIGTEGNSLSVSASAGTAFYPDDGTTVSELFKSADKSMYAQKRGSSVA